MRSKSGSVTIDDVARVAGVSRTTTSLVLRGQVEGRVSSEVVERVRRVMLDLNYRPSTAARELSSKNFQSQRTGTIGYLIHSVGDPVADLYYGELLLGARLEAQRSGQHLLMGHSHDRYDEIKGQVLTLTGTKVDGWLIGGYYNQDLLEFLRETKIPAVWVGSAMDTTGFISQVRGDDYQGGYLAVRHLAELGHRDIACIFVYQYSPWVSAMEDGGHKALREFGISDFACPSMFHNLQTGLLENLLDEILSMNPRPTALFMRGDPYACQAAQILEERGISIPEEMTIIGYDGLPVGEMMRPALTTITVPRRDIGAVAVRRLLEVTESPDIAPSTTVLPVELCERDSCGVPANVEEVLAMAK